MSEKRECAGMWENVRITPCFTGVSVRFISVISVLFCDIPENNGE